MGQLAVQFSDQGLHRVLFDIMPLPVFVEDKDVYVLECNTVAARLLGHNKRTRKPQRAGNVLHCLHTKGSPGGCGCAPTYVDCGLREAVRAACRGRSVKRRRAEMEPIRRGKPTKVNLRVSCQPFTYGKSSFMHLALEGLNN